MLFNIIQEGVSYWEGEWGLGQKAQGLPPGDPVFVMIIPIHRQNFNPSVSSPQNGIENHHII